MSITKRYALSAIIILALVGIAEFIVLMRSYNLNTASATQQFDKMINTFRSSTEVTETLQEAVRSTDTGALQAIILFSFIHGTEYVHARSTEYVIQNSEGEFQLRKPSRFSLTLARNFYTPEGRSYQLDAMFQIINPQLFRSLLRNLGLVTVLLLLGGSVIVLVFLTSGYRTRRTPEKKHMSPQAALSVPASLKFSSTALSQQKPLAKTHEVPAVSHSGAPVVSPSETAEIKGIPELYTPPVQDSTPPPEESPAIAQQEAVIEELTTPTEESYTDTPITTPSASDILLKEDNVPTPSVLAPSEKDEVLPVSTTSSEDTVSPSPSEEPFPDPMVQAEEKLQEEMQRGLFVHQHLSLLLIEVSDAEADRYKECYQLLKELLPLHNTFFHLSPSTFLCVLPSAGKKEAEQQSLHWQKNLKENFRISTRMGMSSLMNRILEPHMFIQEVTAVLQKAKEQERDFLSFVPNPKKFFRMLADNPQPAHASINSLHFHTLATLPLPSDEEVEGIDDPALKKYELSLKKFSSHQHRQ